jgi:hypothetical protein
MAEPSIVQGLFGITPESYQQQRDAEAYKRAAAFGQMDPMQSARTSIFYGANQLGNVAAGMLGAEDPQMRLISQRNALAQQFDVSTPEGLAQYAGALQQIGDTQGALEVSNISRKAASEVALAKQRMFEKQGVDPIQQLIRAGKHTPQSISLYAKSGDIKDLELIEKPAKGPTPTEIERLQLYRQQLIDNKAPASQIAEVDAFIKGASSPRGTVVQNVMPGQKEFVDIPKFRATVQNTIDPQLKVIDATDNALAAISDSITNNNPISFNAAKVQLAKSLGDSQLSRRDVEAAGGDPSIYGKLIDTTSEFFTSTPSIDTQKKIQSTLNVVRNLNAKKASNEIDAQRKIAARQKYDPDAVAEALDFPQLKSKPKGSRTITLKSGKTVTVVEE